MADIMKVEGLQETMQMLRDMPKTIVAKGFVKALSAAGNVVADELEINTPVKSEDTGGLLDEGELREDIMVQVELDSQLRGGTASVGFSKKSSMVALWLEYGHRLVSHKGKLLGEVKANPFMRRTADAAWGKAVDAFARSLEQTVAAEYPQNRAA